MPALNLTQLILQIVVVLATCRAIGSLACKLGQPRVNGEMIAGILLGPSLFGRNLPQLATYLFPAASLEYVNVLAQMGVILFMFLVGLEFDTKELAGQTRITIAATLASILAPILLGFVLAQYLYPRYGATGVSFTAFAEFIGASMAITAFPMLARILRERRISTTRVGIVALASAGIAGVSSWCLLTYLTIESTAGGSRFSATSLVGIPGLVAFLFVIGKPLMRPLADAYAMESTLSDGAMSTIALLASGSSLAAGYLGLHPLFGAFLFGAILPKQQDFVTHLCGRLEAITSTVLLPLFFAFSGLRTNIGLIHGEAWFGCVLSVLAATMAKFGSVTLTARASGMTIREAGRLCALLNARGLIALVFLNIGLDLRLITPTVFTMMVMMAVVTTLMTTPLMDLFALRDSNREFTQDLQLQQRIGLQSRRRGRAGV
jgi:Kef-type K+ transport system membrane component KefB